MLLARAAGTGQGAAPLGCVALRPLGPAGIAEMKRLYVVPAGRGMGLGLALVEAVLGEARRIGYARVVLDTLPFMAEAVALYRRAGFTGIAPYYETPVAGTIFLGHALGA